MTRPVPVCSLPMVCSVVPGDGPAAPQPRGPMNSAVAGGRVAATAVRLRDVALHYATPYQEFARQLADQEA